MVSWCAYFYEAGGEKLIRKGNMCIQKALEGILFFILFVFFSHVTLMAWHDMAFMFIMRNANTVWYHNCHQTAMPLA